MTRLLSTTTLAPLLLLCSNALAQGLDELDENEAAAANDANRSRAKPEVKEVVKGFYMKSNVGGAGYLLDFRGYVSAGTAVGLSVGQDFVDREKTSMAWEVGFWQGIHNGTPWELQAQDGCRSTGIDENGDGRLAPCTQGDMRTYSLLANYEVSKYPTRRFGIGLRAGAGVLFSPLLIEDLAYSSDVLPEFGSDPGYHGVPHVLGFAGPSFEYYSKLSHFSVGADVDVFYAVGFDLGFNATGYMKYTF